jgi:hypothetical protein
VIKNLVKYQKPTLNFTLEALRCGQDKTTWGYIPSLTPITKLMRKLLQSTNNLKHLKAGFALNYIVRA